MVCTCQSTVANVGFRLREASAYSACEVVVRTLQCTKSTTHSFNSGTLGELQSVIQAFEDSAGGQRFKVIRFEHIAVSPELYGDDHFRRFIGSYAEAWRKTRRTTAGARYIITEQSALVR